MTEKGNEIKLGLGTVKENTNQQNRSGSKAEMARHFYFCTFFEISKVEIAHSRKSILTRTKSHRREL